MLVQLGCLFPLHFLGLVGFYLSASSVTYYFVIPFLVSGAMFLSCWLFDLRHPGLEFGSS